MNEDSFPNRRSLKILDSNGFKFAAIIGLGLLSSFSALAGGEVSSNTDEALRAAMADGGTVTFSFDGVITLTNSIVVANNTIVDGSGHGITISGGNAVRLFKVNAGVSASFVNLTLANGQHTGSNGVVGISDGQPGMGGAILNNGGTVALTGCVVISNNATGGSGIAGASAQPGSAGGPAQGGAIFNAGGTLAATNSSFIANSAIGGAGHWGSTVMAGLPGGDATGGAIWSTGGSVTIQTSTFSGNLSKGGPTEVGLFSQFGPAGSGSGGALWTDTATVHVYGSTFITNQAIGSDLPGGLGGGGKSGVGKGGAIFATNGVLDCAGSWFGTNIAKSGTSFRSPVAGIAQGGAIWIHSSASISQASFFANQAFGNVGGFGAEGSGGAIFSDNSLLLSSSSLVHNLAQGGTSAGAIGNNPPGGQGRGGAIFNLGVLITTNCTLAANSARSGDAPTNPGGPIAIGAWSLGGALFNTTGTATLINLSFVSNNVTGGHGSSVGGQPIQLGVALGGAICNTNGTLNLGNTIVAFSSALAGTNAIPSTNYYGPVIDLGNNLNSESPGFPAGPGNLNNVNPVLGPLDDYGGPTPSLPLLAGSPAIDAANTALGPTTDQRGRSRPYGSASDIGAFESSPPYVIRGLVSGPTLHEEIPVQCESTNTTTSQGRYTLTVNAGANTVIPTNSDYVFFPASRTIATGPDWVNIDFKAYRWNTFSLESFSGGTLRYMFAGTNGETYRVLFSTDLYNWIPVLTNTPVNSNLFDLFDPSVRSRSAGFYRTVHP